MGVALPPGVTLPTGVDPSVVPDATGVIRGERTIAGTAAGESLSADSDGDWFINGQGGNDTLSGMGGNDTLMGMDGSDVLYGGAGIDTAAYPYAPEMFSISVTGDTVVITGSDILPGATGTDTLYGMEKGLFSGVEVDLATLKTSTVIDYGTAGADVLLGSVTMDTLGGGAGDDILRAGFGADSVDGGDGNDALYGNPDADTLFGGAGADTVYGGQGNDAVSGGDGDDLLGGNRGNDTLTGGAGADRFEFGAEGGADTVADFDGASGDRIHLAAGLTATVSAGASGTTVLTLSDGGTITLTGVPSTAFDTAYLVTV